MPYLRGGLHRLDHRLRRCSTPARRRCRRCGTSARPPRRRSSPSSTSPGLICEAAEWPRSEQPSAARTPNPFSVKFSPTRVFAADAVVLAPDDVGAVSTPPCMMKSSTSQPRSLMRQRGDDGRALAPALAHGARRRCTRRRPPTPGTSSGMVRTRPKPGSRRSITSPNDDAVPFAVFARRADFEDLGHGHLPRIFRIELRWSRAPSSRCRLVVLEPSSSSLVIELGTDAGRQTIPALNHLVSDSSVGSTPPVGISLVHGHRAADRLGDELRAADRTSPGRS